MQFTWSSGHGPARDTDAERWERFWKSCEWFITESRWLFFLQITIAMSADEVNKVIFAETLIKNVHTIVGNSQGHSNLLTISPAKLFILTILTTLFENRIYKTIAFNYRCWFVIILCDNSIVRPNFYYISNTFHSTGNVFSHLLPNCPGRMTEKQFRL